MTKELGSKLNQCMRAKRKAQSLEMGIIKIIESNYPGMTENNKFIDSIGTKIEYAIYENKTQLLKDIELALEGRWLEIGEG